MPAAQAPLQSIAPGGPRTLLPYVDQEQGFLNYLKEHHPIFAIYQKDGRLLGTPRVSDREEEFIEFGGAPAFLHAQHGETGQSQELAHAAITYRLGEESILDLPNNFVGPKKCGECHPAQYEVWKRSRHALNVRFPDELVEVADLNAPVYPPSPAAVLSSRSSGRHAPSTASWTVGSCAGPTMSSTARSRTGPARSWPEATSSRARSRTG
jgi:hypothetical protein